MKAIRQNSRTAPNSYLIDAAATISDGLNSAVLSPGDVVQIGNRVLRFETAYLVDPHPEALFLIGTESGVSGRIVELGGEILGVQLVDLRASAQTGIQIVRQSGRVFILVSLITMCVGLGLGFWQKIAEERSA